MESSLWARMNIPVTRSKLQSVFDKVTFIYSFIKCLFQWRSGQEGNRNGNKYNISMFYVTKQRRRLITV